MDRKLNDIVKFYLEIQRRRHLRRAVPVGAAVECTRASCQQGATSVPGSKVSAVAKAARFLFVSIVLKYDLPAFLGKVEL